MELTIFEEHQMANHITAADAPRFGQDGFDMTGLAAPSRGCSTLSTWRIRAQPGAASPVHRLTSDEAFVVVRGELTATLDGQDVVVRAGDSLSVPPGVDFRIANRSAEPFEAIASMAAGGQATVGDGAPFTPPWAA
ncbi:cupin domain-containing protein [Conexibacter woesei]|uniref:cupin domain-containing protein n=1 Tax=Conexibacter woesei TaxID=191495 RepID=UPI00040CF5C5|nr:cupin domain-containing protein [Conexibacter woesei]